MGDLPRREPPPPNDHDTLGRTKEWLDQHREEGVCCPACGQFAKVYTRKINSGMARALVLMYRAGGEDFVHKPSVLGGVGSAARDESLLRYWGLLEEESAMRPDGGRAGWWRVTHLGFEWIHGMTKVLSHARVYDGELLGLVGDMVTIEECLGSKFNLSQLLAA